MPLGYFIDVQGTILSDEDKSPLNGSIEFLKHLKAKNIPYILITNNTKQLSCEFKSELFAKGFEFEHFIDPLMVLKDRVKSKSVYGFGSQKFIQVLKRLDLHVNEINPDIILIASDDSFCSEDFAKMIHFVLNGAKIFALHATSLYAKNDKRYPGVGAILAMLEYATSQKGEVIGKPSEVFYITALKELKKQKSSIDFSQIMMISDDAKGDLVGAKELGMQTSLVLSGKCKNVSEIQTFKDKIDNVYQNIEQIYKEIC